MIPPWVDLEEYTIASIKDVFSLIGSHSLTTSWLIHLLSCEKMYIDLCTARIEWSPQQARSVLPNSLKTEIVISGNLREWLHFFKLRTAAAAHPQMREIADMLLINVRQRVPVIFEDLSKGD